MADHSYLFFTIPESLTAWGSVLCALEIPPSTTSALTDLYKTQLFLGYSIAVTGLLMANVVVVVVAVMRVVTNSLYFTTNEVWWNTDEETEVQRAYASCPKFHS